MQPLYTGENTTSIHWWKHDLYTLVKIRPLYTGENTTNIHWWKHDLYTLVKIRPLYTGENTTYIHWWKHDLYTLVKTQPQYTGEITTSIHWCKYDLYTLVKIRPLYTGENTTYIHGCKFLHLVKARENARSNEKGPILIFFSFFFFIRRFSLNVRKRALWHLRPTKTQISLRIRAVRSESSLSAWKKPLHPWMY